jgi:mono/diheme cytochrome c family protein
MCKRWLMALGLFAIALGAASDVHAASTPAQKCAATKLKAASTKTAADLKCHKKALLTGGAVDDACLAKSQLKFERAFEKAEAKGGCSSEGDAAEIAASIDAQVGDLVAALEPPKSFAQNVQPIFSAHCTSCHSGSFPPQGLNLSAGNAFANLVGVASMEQAEVDRVVPGDPDASYLFRKITGAVGISGQQMPLSSAPLSDAEIHTIEAWIEQGALDN